MIRKRGVRKRRRTTCAWPPMTASCSGVYSAADGWELMSDSGVSVCTEGAPDFGAEYVANELVTALGDDLITEVRDVVPA